MSASAPTRSLFGTDGIRGRANAGSMTPEVAMRVGMAVASHFGDGSIVIGKDTRLSGYMLETALASGLCAMGADVMLVGPLPTPGIAYITRSMRADAGVVISASHNPYEDNGIKLFASDGFKLPDDVEAELERLMTPGALESGRVHGAKIGRARRIDDATGRYVTHLKHAFPNDLGLDGLKIVIDCAHGAGYRAGPAVLSELGAEVIVMGGAPNGTNINEGCGAMFPTELGRRVVEEGADLGVALDGDADRAVFCDHTGDVVDGDAILALCARAMKQRGELQGAGVVATVMSNLGLERALEEVGLTLVRTNVGDRYVVEAMRAGGYNLGGEQSGHLVFLDHATTGDGVIAALQVLAVIVRSETPLRDLAGGMKRYPQVQRGVRVSSKPPVREVPALVAAISAAESRLGADGRVLVRYSGTEPKLRVMVEGLDDAVVNTLADELAAVATEALGA